MGKKSSVLVLDGTLDIIAACDQMHACAGEPTGADDAAVAADIVTRSLAFATMGAPDYTKGAGTPDGRQVAMAQKDDESITASGTADHVCTLNTVTDAWECTTCTPVVLAVGGTVTFGSWTSTVRNAS